MPVSSTRNAIENARALFSTWFNEKSSETGVSRTVRRTRSSEIPSIPREYVMPRAGTQE